MSSYYSRYCEQHGDWEQDIDRPGDECPDCEKEGIAPSQLIEKRIIALQAEVESWKILAHKSLERIDDAYTHGWADGHHNTGWSGRDEIKRRLELARLEREIASHTVIESFDIGHFEWHRISENDPDWIIAQYGLLRGLLETHPTEKDLVRLREHGE